MATTAAITTNTTTTIDVPAGDHVLDFMSATVWDTASVNIRHAGSEQSFSGLGALTATPSNASVITTGGESIEVVTTGVGGSTSIIVRVNRSTPRV
tara:strand:- start:1711 stop:1998 length:288 start_codon:yes stop_codon:yes gene_type:complete